METNKIVSAGTFGRHYDLRMNNVTSQQHQQRTAFHLQNILYKTKANWKLY